MLRFSINFHKSGACSLVANTTCSVELLTNNNNCRPMIVEESSCYSFIYARIFITGNNNYL